MIDGLCQELRKLLVVEDLEAAATGDLADSGGVETVVIVAVATLDKDAAVTQTFSIHLSSYIVQMDSCKVEENRILNASYCYLPHYYFFYNKQYINK